MLPTSGSALRFESGLRPSKLSKHIGRICLDRNATGILMKSICLTLSIVLMLSACASGQSGQRSELNRGSRCIDICSSEFTGCTQDPSNDFTSCSSLRTKCEADCRAQRADEERQASEERIEPVDESMEDSSDSPMSEEEIDQELIDDPLEGEGVSRDDR